MYYRILNKMYTSYYAASFIHERWKLPILIMLKAYNIFILTYFWIFFLSVYINNNVEIKFVEK